MRKLSLVFLLSVAAVVPGLWTAAKAQQPIQPQMLYARQRVITIPFDPDPTEAHRLKQLQLYYSNDLGKSWHLGATAAPEQRKFIFNAEGDGLYLFAVQTTDFNNRVYPERMDGITPQLRIVIDTVPPSISFKPLPPRPNEVGVAWDVRDDNIDLSLPDTIRLEYRAAGSANWLPLFRAPGASQVFWNPGTNGPVEVRLKARDLAGNTNEATVSVGLGNQSAFGNPPFNGGNAGGDPPAPGVSTLDPYRRFLNSKTIVLNYEIKEKGPSGVSGIELWATEDGRSWSKLQLPKLADPTFQGPLTFEVPREGVYGFTLIARSGVGLSERPPQVGDKPQIWIEVDLTKPVVELQSVLVGEGENKGRLSLGWTAKDKNLGKTPITLSYSTQNTGPWTAFAENLPNTGHYIWTMPKNNMPWQFYLKVEAADLAGNVGEAITPGLVKVDLAQPKASIIDVQAGGK
jgi:hypothetical protein